MVLELDRREDDNTLVEVSLSDDDALQLFLSTALREVFVVVRTRTDEETFTAVAERVRARIDKHQAKLREADALTREEERKQARQKAEDKYDRWQEKLEKLVISEQLRKERGEALYKYVSENRTMQGNVERWRGFLGRIRG